MVRAVSVVMLLRLWNRFIRLIRWVGLRKPFNLLMWVSLTVPLIPVMKVTVMVRELPLNLSVTFLFLRRRKILTVLCCHKLIPVLLRRYRITVNCVKRFRVRQRRFPQILGKSFPFVIISISLKKLNLSLILLRGRLSFRVTRTLLLILPVTFLMVLLLSRNPSDNPFLVNGSLM